MLSPDYYYRSVLDIDLPALKRRGIDTLLVDLDNTLLPRDTSMVPDEVKAWAIGLRDVGFSACLVSNNWHERVVHAAEELGFGLVSKAVKPLPFAFRAALKCAGSTADRAAVVGDQLFTDVLGGKWTGMTTILIAPMSSADLPHTLFLRRIERVLLAGRQPLP
jgi:HAD superfamily phosphatase (TIGR01668 family)